MSSERSELASMATQLSELQRRVTDVAERLNNGETENVAVTLFESERALRTALRAIERCAEQLG